MSIKRGEEKRTEIVETHEVCPTCGTPCHSIKTNYVKYVIGSNMYEGGAESVFTPIYSFDFVKKVIESERLLWNTYVRPIAELTVGKPVDNG